MAVSIVLTVSLSNEINKHNAQQTETLEDIAKNQDNLESLLTNLSGKVDKIEVSLNDINKHNAQQTETLDDLAKSQDNLESLLTNLSGKVDTIEVSLNDFQAGSFSV